MALYERLLGRDDAGNGVEGKIPIHAFQAVMAERARGSLATDAAARDAINSLIDPDLSAGEQTEALTLLGTLTGTGLVKLARAKEIDDVLMLAEHGAVGYVTPAQVKTRLGV